MTRGDAARIRDILEAAEMAARIAAEGREAFFSDWKNQPVAAQMISIIGVAAASLTEATKAQYPEIPWKDVRGMRNFVAHEYFRIEPEIVWHTLQTSIPDLARALQAEPMQRGD